MGQIYFSDIKFRNSSLVRPVCSSIPRSVPIGITFLYGIITNLVSMWLLFTIAIWLPLPLLARQ